VKTILFIISLIISVYSASYTEITNHSEALARYYEIPHEIVLAVIRAESDFKVDAVSDKGAHGLMQITKICYTHYTNWYPSTIYTNFDMVKTNWKFNIEKSLLCKTSKLEAGYYGLFLWAMASKDRII
jgi:hypothetical protein